MSADTFTTAIFLITAVIAASVLVSAIFPVVYQMSGTFTSASHTADQQMRTNIQIVLNVAYYYGNPPPSNSPNIERVWMKNTGNRQIPVAEINQADVFCGDVGNFKRMNGPTSGPYTNNDVWAITPYFSNLNSWSPGETLEVDCYPSTITGTTDPVYFQFVLPNGISASDQFTVSTTP